MGRTLSHLHRYVVGHTKPRTLVRVGRVEVKTTHAKAFCAYGGAVLLGFDVFGSCIGRACAPHAYHALEPLVTLVCAKLGAFLSAAAVFFDRIFE